MIGMEWLKHMVPDPETCVLLREINFPQKGTELIWVDTKLVNHDDTPVYRLMRRADWVSANPNFFAAYTGEEFQRVLPENFFPYRLKDQTFVICNLYGSEQKIQQNPDKDTPISRSVAMILKRVNGSGAKTLAQAWAQATIFLIQQGELTK